MSTAPTPNALRRSSRRVDRLNRSVAIVMDAMRNGCTLHAEFCQAGLRWRMSNGRFVSDEVAKIIIIDKRIVGVGDTLLPSVPSQTFRFVEEI
jgi:hypothetical protein